MKCSKNWTKLFPEAYDVFGMHIHDCYASSDVEQQFPILDKNGYGSMVVWVLGVCKNFHTLLFRFVWSVREHRKWGVREISAQPRWEDKVREYGS